MNTRFVPVTPFVRQVHRRRWEPRSIATNVGGA